MASKTKEQKKAEKAAKKAAKAEKKEIEKEFSSRIKGILRGIEYCGEVNYINNLRKTKAAKVPGNLFLVRSNKRIYMWTGNHFVYVLSAK